MRKILTLTIMLWSLSALASDEAVFFNYYIKIDRSGDVMELNSRAKIAMDRDFAMTNGNHEIIFVVSKNNDAAGIGTLDVRVLGTNREQGPGRSQNDSDSFKPVLWETQTKFSFGTPVELSTQREDLSIEVAVVATPVRQN